MTDKKFMELVDAYAECRHRHGGYAYNSTTAIARMAVLEALAHKKEPVAWAISYDGVIPHALWQYGDEESLDSEIKRIGGTATKMALYSCK